MHTAAQEQAEGQVEHSSAWASRTLHTGCRAAAVQAAAAAAAAMPARRPSALCSSHSASNARGAPGITPQAGTRADTLSYRSR